MKVTFGDDLRNPACLWDDLSKTAGNRAGLWAHSSHIVFVALNVLQIQCHRVPSRVFFVYIADAMGCQINLSILLIWQLVLSTVCCLVSPACSVKNAVSKQQQQ